MGFTSCCLLSCLGLNCASQFTICTLAKCSADKGMQNNGQGCACVHMPIGACLASLPISLPNPSPLQTAAPAHSSKPHGYSACRFTPNTAIPPPPPPIFFESLPSPCLRHTPPNQMVNSRKSFDPCVHTACPTAATTTEVKHIHAQVCFGCACKIIQFAHQNDGRPLSVHHKRACVCPCIFSDSSTAQHTGSGA